MPGYWSVPFIATVPFYSSNGTLIIDLAFFKSIMIVISSITAAILIVWSFRAVSTSYTKDALITGFVWLAINGGLDAVVIVGLLGMPAWDYLTQIAIRYLMIPAIVIAAEVVAGEAVHRNER